MFNYRGNSKIYREATNKANELLTNDMFYMYIKSAKHFDMSDVTNEKLVRIMQKHKFDDVTVKVVYKWWNPYWRFRITHGMFSSNRPNEFEVNGYIKKSVSQLVGTYIHEWIHVLDNIYMQYSFGHGSNSPDGKHNTAPYFIGRLAKKLTNKILDK